MPATEASGLTPFERFLRLFTEVREGEGFFAVLLSLNIFLILTAYYILKPVREALILGQGSAELKSYLAAAQVLVMIVAVKLYALLTDRYPRRRLINVVTIFFAGCLVLFFALAGLGVRLGVVFYVWLGIFNMMIVAQFWSFANDVYSREQGERLFPIVAFGSSLGAVLGSVIAGLLIERIGVYQLMLVAAVLLVLEVQITNYADSRERKRAASEPAAEEETRSETGPEPEVEEAVGGRSGAFALVFKTRYLLLIALLLMFTNWVNTTGEYILGSVVETRAEEAVASGEAGGLSVEEFIGEFYAGFFGVVNVVALLMQLFLVSRVVKYLGVALAIMILPLTSLGAYLVLALHPVLSYVRWAKTAENATDYSLNNTVRNMLFLPTTREQKYKAKQAIDSFFVRVGDVLSALLVFAGTTFFALRPSGFAKVNVVLVLIWLALAWLIGREYKRLVASGKPPG